MNWIENILIIAGISLDIFASMECQGSLVAKVDKKQLTAGCALVTAWQLAAFAVGDLFAILLYLHELTHDERMIGLMIAAVIFFGLGIRLLWKAICNERMHERREEGLNLKRFLRMLASTSIYTVLAGMAFGFLKTNLISLLVTTLCITILVVIAGIYTGYHFGFTHKNKAYVVGTVLLWAAGIDVVVRHILLFC